LLVQIEAIAIPWNERKKSWEFNEWGKFSKLQPHFQTPIMLMDEIKEEVIHQPM
jgi:hypothetical protein